MGMRSKPEKGEASGKTPAFPVVGIGASAGGLDAFRRFFRSLPPRNGMAFVLVQHLDPTHRSYISQLLSRHTSMRVVEAQDRMRVEPDTVYVIPPNRSLTLRRGLLRLREPSDRRGTRTPIDKFFCSLAEEIGEKAIGILLSSTGTDGVMGLRALKAEGGMVMVQDPQTALYGDLPQSAVATGLVDYVMPVERMPRALLRYARHSYVSGPPAAVSEAGAAGDYLDMILALLRAKTSHDFRHYKKSTLVRRVERRMGLRQAGRLHDYVKILQDDPEEAGRLAKDFLIGVTRFFRDPAAFEELRVKVVSRLVRLKDPARPVRVWVPGCATGEEAYSLAMLLIEEGEAAGRPHGLQIFATDIDENSIQIARRGVYPEGIRADVSPPRLRRFFALKDQSYVVNKQLRDVVVFAAQNMLTAPPFSKIDLLSCRNVAIYLEPEAQRNLVQVFFFAINPGGHLFLGNSESIGHRDDLFRVVSKRSGIYRRIGGAHLDFSDVAVAPARKERPREAARLPPVQPPVSLDEINRRLLLEHHDSAAVLIDRGGKILHLHGPTGKYLELPAGEATLDLHAVAREGLRARLRAAVQTAEREDRQIVMAREGVRRGGAYHPVRITITPVKNAASAEGLLHVVFEDVPETPADAAPGSPAAGPREAVLRQLESELKSTRENLQSTIEQLEISNEELMVSNEEVMSSNEELQSTNEELETSKEELQSLNEELTTVNSQLQEKVQELTGTNNDLANLLSSTDVATVFLDTRFRVKRFTPQVTRLLNVIPADVGRPIGHITQNLVDADLLGDAQTVLRRLAPVRREVRGKDGASYVMRVLPYRTTDNVIEGVVITFSDVSDLAAQKAKLREQEQRQRIISDLGLQGLAGVPPARLMDRAARGVAEALKVDLCDILEADEAGGQLLLRAGTGWRPGSVGKASVRLDSATAPGQAARTGVAVVVDGLRQGKRVRPSRLQARHGVSSCAYVVVSSPRGRSGLLGVHSRKRRAFSQDDVHFLQAVANILADAAARERGEFDLRALSRSLERRVREKTAWLWLLQEITRAANETESVSEVIRFSLERLCRVVGWRFGHGYLAAPDRPGRLALCQAWYPEGAERFRPFEKVSRREDLREGRWLPRHVLRVGRVRWISDPAKQLFPARARVARRMGLRTAAAFPVKTGSATVAVLEVFSDRAVEPQKALVEVMGNIGTQIGRVVERNRARARFFESLWRENCSVARGLHEDLTREVAGLEKDCRRPGKAGTAGAIRETLGRIRLLLRGILPVEVEPRRLGEELSRLAERTRDLYGIRCAFRGGARVSVADSRTATHLYRIAQEAVMEAVRRARVRTVRIGLRSGRGGLVLEIRDDGRRPSGERAGGRTPAVRLMRCRADLLGATLSVRPAPGRGTSVVCILPGEGGRRG